MLFNKDLLSERIQAEIAERGMSVAEFANMLGVSRDSVYNWIRKRNGIQDNLLPEIAEKLGVNPFWLIGASDSKAPLRGTDSLSSGIYAQENLLSEFHDQTAVYAAGDRVKAAYIQSSNNVQQIIESILKLTPEDFRPQH